MNSKSLQNIDISFVQKLELIMLISWVIEWSKSGMLQMFDHLEIHT